MRWTAIILLVLLSVVGYGQRFIASTNAATVVENTTFTVKFELQNGQGRNFRPPSFSGFKLISGPSTSSSTTIVNGKMSSSYTLSYTLLATQKGSYTIAPAQITADGKVITSNPVKVKVVEGSDVPGGQDVFIKAELSTDTAYVGQQVVLALKLYTQVSVERYDVLMEPEFEDIYVSPLPRYARQSQLEVMDGKQYSTQVLSQWALYPQKSGMYNLDGYLLRLGIPEEGQRRSRGFFFTSRLKTKDVKTNPIQFEVLTLPEPKPQSFSGGVGLYRASMRSDRTRLTTDDAISLTVEIVGNGDQRMLSAPDLNLGAAFDLYDANEVFSKASTPNGRDQFTKRFEYLIVPEEPGIQWLKPEFSYFNPDSGRYITQIIDSVRLEVSKGTSESKALKKFKEEQKIDLRPLVAEWEPYSPSKYFLDQPWYWSLWGLLSLSFIGLIWVKKRRDDEANMDPTERRFLKARKRAEERLKVAKEYIDDDSGQQFFEEVALGIKKYLGDKFQLDPAHFTKNSIAEHLATAGAKEGLIASTEKVLSDCDMALFAPGLAPDRKETFEKALSIVMEVEELMRD